MNNEQRIQTIHALLTKALSPIALEINDESHLHVGHPGAKTGMGHFSVRIASTALNGLSRVKQHQMIYQALGDLLKTDIHALRIEITA